MNKKNIYTLLLSIAVLCGGTSLFAGSPNKKSKDPAQAKTLSKQPQNKISVSKKKLKKLMPQKTDIIDEEIIAEENIECYEPPLCEIEPAEPPYKEVSDYIACWFSGKMYWDESLKKLQIRYDYDDQYIKRNKDELIKSHVIPREADYYIKSLAKREARFNQNGSKQTGWFYTIPGYLEDHTTGIKEPGIFTWGVSYDNCYHRGFSIRDDEVYALMEKYEQNKQKYHTNKNSSAKPITLHENYDEHNIVTDDAWDIIISNPETNTTVYLSKCVYKDKIEWKE